MEKETHSPDPNILNITELAKIYETARVALTAAREAETAVISARRSLITALPELPEALKIEAACEITKVCWSLSGSLSELWLELKLGERTYFLYYNSHDYPSLGTKKGLTVVSCPPETIPSWSSQAMVASTNDENWPRMDSQDPDFRKICGIAIYHALPTLSCNIRITPEVMRALISSLPTPETD
jgi:hypothetical protein